MPARFLLAMAGLCLLLSTAAPPAYAQTRPPAGASRPAAPAPTSAAAAQAESGPVDPIELAAEKEMALSVAASRLASGLDSDRKFFTQSLAALPGPDAAPARDRVNQCLADQEELLRGFRALAKGLTDLARALERQKGERAAAAHSLELLRQSRPQRLEAMLSARAGADRLVEDQRLALMDVENASQRVAAAKTETDRLLAAQRKARDEATTLSSPLGVLGRLLKRAFSAAAATAPGAEVLAERLERRRKSLEDFRIALVQERVFRSELEFELACRKMETAQAELEQRQLSAGMLTEALEKVRKQVGLTPEEVRRSEQVVQRAAAEAAVQQATAEKTAEKAREEGLAAATAEDRLRRRQQELERELQRQPTAGGQERLDARALLLEEEDRATQDRKLLASEREQLAGAESDLAKAKQSLATEQGTQTPQILEIVREVYDNPDRTSKIEALYRVSQVGLTASEQDGRGVQTELTPLRKTRESLAKRVALQAQRAAKEREKPATGADGALARVMAEDLRLLRQRLELADSAIATHEELAKVHEDRARFFRDTLRTLAGYRRESDTRVTAVSFAEAYAALREALAKAPGTVARWPADLRRHMSRFDSRERFYKAVAGAAALLVFVLGLYLLGLRSGRRLMATGSPAVCRAVELSLDLLGPLLSFAAGALCLEVLTGGWPAARALVADPFLFVAVYRLLRCPLLLCQVRLARVPAEAAERARFPGSACRWGVRVLRWALWLLILEHVLRNTGATGSVQFLASAVRNMGLLTLLVAFLTLERRSLGRLLEVGEEGSYAALLALYNRAVLQLYSAALAFVAIVGGLWLSGYQDRAEWVLRSTGLTLLVLLATWAAHRWAIALLRRKVPDDSEGATPWYRSWMEHSVRALLAALSLLALGDVWAVQVRLMYGTFTSTLLRDAALRTAMVLVIVLAARFAVLTMRFIIYRVFAIRTVAAGTEPVLSPRGMTLAPLLTSVVRYTVYFIAAVLALQTVGLDPTPLVAGAGVVGLAVGFGAQSLVKDVITGFFIIAEDLVSVGEVVELDGKVGVVEEITVRVTMLRLYSGELRTIPNSEIRQIGNRSRGFMRAIVPVTIRRRVDADLAMQTLREIVQAFHERHRDIVLGPPEVHGILDMDPLNVTIRAVVKVRPAAVVDAEHELRREIRRVFDQRGLGFRRPTGAGAAPEPAPEPAAPPPALKPPR